jgi:4-carboxymuconolactone decarboxylase
VNDIAAGRRPHFEKDDERVVCDFVTTLHETRSIPEGLYRTTVAALGEQGVVELVGLLGYYTLISMTLNVFDIDAADAANPDLKA